MARDASADTRPISQSGRLSSNHSGNTTDAVIDLPAPGGIEMMSFVSSPRSARSTARSSAAISSSV